MGLWDTLKYPDHRPEHPSCKCASYAPGPPHTLRSGQLAYDFISSTLRILYIILGPRVEPSSQGDYGTLKKCTESKKLRTLGVSMFWYAAHKLRRLRRPITMSRTWISWRSTCLVVGHVFIPSEVRYKFLLVHPVDSLVSHQVTFVIFFCFIF